MSHEIPVSWLSYCPENPARGRWDQAYLDRLLHGEEWRPPSEFRFVSTPWKSDDERGRVIVFPCGHYTEHGEEHTARWKLTRDLTKLPWAVVIATSDECASFRWHLIDPWPQHVQLWVMLPRTGHKYPPGTRFIGEGSPVSSRAIREIGGNIAERDIDLFFSGQGGHARRSSAVAAMRREMPGITRQVNTTRGFTRGMPPGDYYGTLRRTWFAPAPSGICSQSSFRFFEALEAGAIPIVDGIRPGLNVNDGYWTLLGLDKITTVIDEWRDLSAVIGSQHPRRHNVSAHVQARWQQYKRRLAHQLHDDVGRFTERRPVAADDGITVIVPTSPVPSNPSIDGIVTTVQSVRDRLPNAEILITCDGVRNEQSDRVDGYDEFLYNLTQWTLTQHNVCPFIFHDHQHQSGMMRTILNEVTTEFVLYVEHDCPLEGVIPFDEILGTMTTHELSTMRFHHEVEIQHGSHHLFLDHFEGSLIVPHRQTLQWSQRPHVARTDWYRNIMAAYFGSESRTMIEDVMHGVVQHGLPPWHADLNEKDTYAWRIRADEVWKRWRMAVYAPQGSWKRSGHLDARADDPKFPMRIAYDNGRPEGAPPEGWL